MDVEQAADRLYRLPPGQFVAARNQAADQARAGGDRDLAARIRALRRPTLGAWLANLLALEHAGEVDRLLELGTALRRATEQLHGDELRKLSTQKQAVIAALKRQARAAAVAAGAPPSQGALEDLEQTLLAVLTDPDAAATFMNGRLTGTLSPRASAPAASTSTSSTTKAVPAASAMKQKQHGAQVAERRRRAAQARERAAAADRAARTADADAARARRELDRATAQRDRQRQRVEEFTARLAQARARERDLAAAARTALARVESTDREARRAHARATDAHAHLDQIDQAA